MGGYSYADHMYALSCGLLAVVCAISTGVTIFIVPLVLIVAVYISAIAVLGWFQFTQYRASKKK